MSNVAVAITADTADLNAKLAVAKENLRSLEAATRGLAKQAIATGDAERTTLNPELQKTALATEKARGEVIKLKTSLGEIKPEAHGAFGGLREGFKLTGENLEHLNLQIRDFTSAFSMMGEVFAAGFGIERIMHSVEGVADLGEQLLKLSQTTGISTTTLSEWHYAAQQLGVDTASLDTGLNRLAKSIQEALENPASAAALSFHAMGLSQQFLIKNSNDLEAVLRAMIESFSEHAAGANADALAENTMGRAAADLVPFLRQGIRALDEASAHAHQFGLTMDGPATEAAERYEQQVKNLSAAFEGLRIEIGNKVIPTFTNWVGVLADSMRAGFGAGLVTNYKYQLQELEKQLAELKKTAAGESGLERWWDDRKIKGLEFQIQRTQALLAHLHSTAAGGGGSGEGALSAGYARLGASGDMFGAGGTAGKPAFPNLIPSTAYEDFRAKVAEMQAEWKGTNDGMLRETIRMWSHEVATARLSETEMIESRIALATARKQLNKSETSEAKREAKQQEEIELAKSNTTISLSKIALEAKKQSLASEVAEGKITAQQQVAILEQIATEEYKLDAQELEDKMATLDKSTLAYRRYYDQLLVLGARFNAEMARLDHQRAEAQKHQIDKTAKEWERSFRPVTSAFSSAISGMIIGTQTWQQAVVRMAEGAIQAVVADAVKMAAHWAAMELAKTAATEAGTATRATIQAAGSKEGLAQDAATGLKQIMNNAYKAASGAYNAVVGIPYVGPILAPIAGAAAFAAVAAFGGGLASAEGGMWTVPDNMLANVHKNETILPADVAGPMREFFGAGGGRAAGDVHVNFSISAVDGASVANLLKNNGKTIANVIAGEIRNGNGALRGAMQT